MANTTQHPRNLNYLPYLKCTNTKTNQRIKLLLDTGANKNIIKPGLIPHTKVIKSTSVKNITGTCIINRKGKINFLGPNIPIQTYYEADFHKFFDGIIGSEFFAETNTVINYKNETVTIAGINISYYKFYPSKKTFNHTITLPSDRDGDWFVPKPTKLCKDILVEPGLYQAKNKQTSFLVRTSTPNKPDIPLKKLCIKVNNFETRDFFTPIKKSADKCNDEIESLIRTNHLSKLEKENLLKVLSDHHQVILKDNEKLTSTTKIKHKILTSDDKPIYTKTYRYPHAHKETVREQIQDMLENGIITHSDSPWNAPIWIVPKKTDASGKRKFRVVIDYRKLNEITIDDRHPIPQIEDILDNLGHSQYFTTIDLKSGFHQIEMDENSRQKTAFSTDLGHYEFLRMPFGLKNAPATFQRAMNSILGDLIGKICYVYLDDVIVFGRCLKSHLRNLEKVLERLEQANLKIQLDKCEFLKRNCEFLGHIITPTGIKPNPDKIKEIQDWKLPTSEKQIKQFLGLLGYYRKFIQDYAKLTKPMTKYLKKDMEFKNTDPQFIEAFEKCKKILIADPILRYPDFTMPFILTTDASNYALGAVLSQIHDSKDHPIAFASRTLNKHEINYSTTEKEALAIMWAVEKFKPYLYGNKFTLITDHKPLTFIKNSVKNQKIIRWRLDLENYDYDVVYKTGKTNVVADALSRKIDINANTLEEDPSSCNSQTNNPNESLPDTTDSTDTSDEHYIHFTERPINCFRNQLIFRETSFNTTISEQIFPNYRRTIVCRNSFNPQIITDALKEYHNGRQTAIQAPENIIQSIQDVYREHFSDSNSHFVMTQNTVEDITQEQRQDQIIKNEHERAHRGIQEVENQIKRSFFFPKMVNKIRKFINSCIICAQHKYERKPYNIKISPRPIETAPFNRVHMDIFGIDKHNYLSLICAFSKHLNLIEIPTRNVIDIQNALSQYFLHFGTPKILICDHEASFTSIQLKSFLSELGIQIEFASSSESNGQIEKTHSTIIEMFNTNKHKFPELNSPEIIALVVALYNETVHSATSYKPNEIIFNHRNVINPPDVAEAAQNIFLKVQNHLDKAKTNMTRYNHIKEDPPEIQTNDDIFIKKATRKKIDPRFTTSKCLGSNRRTITIKRNVKRNKNKIKRLRNKR